MSRGYMYVRTKMICIAIIQGHYLAPIYPVCLAKGCAELPAERVGSSVPTLLLRYLVCISLVLEKLSQKLILGAGRTVIRTMVVSYGLLILCHVYASSQETAAGLDQEAPDEAAEDLEEQKPMTTADIWRKSVLSLAGGVALCAVFSDPLVDALTNLSR